MDWNLVARCRPGNFWRTCSMLGAYGEVEHTEHFNVIVAKVDSPRKALAQLANDLDGANESLFSVFVRIAPVDVAFHFTDIRELQGRLKQAALTWNGQIRGRHLGVQVTRPRSTSGVDNESWLRVITDSLLDNFRSARSIVPLTPGDEIPEHTLIVESVADRVGLSLWAKEDAFRFPLLNHVPD